MNEEKLGERVAKVEAIIDDHKDEINRLKDDNVLLHRLTANQEVLTNLVKENQENMKEFSSTMNNVNQNITLLNESQRSMRHEMGSIKDDIQLTNNELAEVKKKAEENADKGKFDVLAFLSKDLPKAIGLALLGFLLAYFGLK